MKAYALLIFLVSLAVAEITGTSSSNDPGDVGNTEFHSELLKRTGNGQICGNPGDCGEGYFCLMFWCIVDDPALFPDVLCRSNSHCNDKGPEFVCLNGLCAPPKAEPVDEPSCIADSDCEGKAKCEGGLCINHDVTAEAPDIKDPACKSDSECGGGQCLNGICLANSRSKMRFARRSPQLICHNDQECAGINGTPGYCNNGICVADPPGKFSTRSPQLVCHNDQECTGINGTPGYCNNGICVADPPRKLTRSPQLVCHNDQECTGINGTPGYCNNGICVADPPRKLTRSPQLVCHNDQECTGINGTPGYCKNGICVADP